ncbi:hypothetical protein FRC01_011288 [Tulasnella sp. 417]|nr:hypothetical protein FRC01_011288 [Tulasnella sp. 417]
MARPPLPQLVSIRIPRSGKDLEDSAPPDAGSTLHGNSQLPVEVLYIIFGLLQDSPKDWATAALVCRSWSDPALDELWRSLPSFLPLLKLVGPYLGRLPLDPASQTLPTSQAGDRYTRYATRVKEITFDDGPSPLDQTVLSSLVELLAEAYPGGTALPNLQKLYWRTGNARAVGLVQSFCPPSLERLSLIARSWEVPQDLVRQLVRSLSTHPNQFKAFELDMRFFEDDSAAMAAELETFIRSQPGSSWVPGRVPNSITPSYLLRENGMVLEGRVARGSTGEVMDSADLAPLLDCSLLEQLTLWFNAELGLDDQGIRRMGGAWTRLETLVLQAGEGINSIQMSCLVALAEVFPVLRHLEVPLDRSGGLPPANEVTARFKSLRNLVIVGGWIQVDEMPSVGEFLARVCGPEVKVNLSPSSLPYYNTSLEEETVQNNGEDNEQTKVMKSWMDIFHRAQEDPRRSE